MTAILLGALVGLAYGVVILAALGLCCLPYIAHEARHAVDGDAGRGQS